jgi:iron(III) transport system substrate-binding protein
MVATLGAGMLAVGCGDDDAANGGGTETARSEPDPVADPDPEASGTEEPLDGDLVVYSGRREPLLQPIIDAFEEDTGINVSVKYGATNELGNALIEERGNPRADVFVGTDAASAESLRSRGVFAVFDDPALEAIDRSYRAVDGAWVGISGRARVIIYNTELVDEADLPRSIFDLTDPKWDGQIAIPSTTNGSFTAWVSSIRKLEGDEAARDLLEGLKDNGAVAIGDHTAVRQAVGRGEFALGLVNHYYYQLEKDAGSPVGVIYTDQADGEIGVLVNVAAASIVEGAAHAENAAAFMRYLLSPEAQELFAALNFEYPLIPGIEDRADYKRGTFEESDVDLHELGAMNDTTIDMIDEVALE